MENESLGSLELEFFINNPQILSQLQETESNFSVATDKIQAEATRAASAIEKLIAKGGFSDSQAEIDAYAASVRNAGDTGRVALSGTDELMRALNADFEAGVITAEEYRASIDHIAEAQARFASQAEQANAAEQVQIGLLQRLQTELAAIQKNKLTLVNVAEIEAANVQIALYAEEIKRLNSLGVTSGDATATAIEKPVGAYNRLKYAAQLYEQQARTSMNPDIIAKYNAKLQEAEAELNRLKNVGKQGFDELGNKLPVEQITAFERALGRATNVSAIAGRVVTQLSRQIISLGVGMLSFAVGAKAIEYIVGLIANLDIFTGRLDQAKHNLEAFNEVNANAAKTAGTEIANLQILYRAATDVNNSMADRIRYAQQIKETYPASFANSSTQAILNGQEADSYKELSDQIIAQAKAKAVADKIAANSVTITTAQIQQAKIRIANANEVAKAQTLPQQVLSRNTDAILTPRQDAINASNDRAKESLQYQQDIIDQAQKTNQFLVGFAGGTAAVANALNKNLNLIKDPLRNFDTIIKNASDKADLDNLKKALQAKLDALAPDDKQIATYQDKIRQVEEIEKKYSPKTTDANADLESAKAAARLMQQITEVQNSYNRKQLSKDDEQVQAIRDRFNKLRAEIEAFNKDPKNKNHQVGSSGLDAAENTAIHTVQGEQSVEPVKQQIEAQKTLYRDYEDYKLKAGSEYADKLYSKEIGDYKTYISYLQSLQPTETDLTSSNPYIKARATALKDYLDKALPAALAQELAVGAKQLQAMILQNEDYQQKRKALIANGEKDAAALRKKGYADEADQVDRNVREQLTALDEAQFKKQASYKALFDNIDKLTTESAKKQVNALYEQSAAALATGKITAEAYDDITKALDSLNQKVNEKLPDGLKQIGQVIGSLAPQVSGLNDGFGKSLSALGSMIQSVAAIKSGIDTLGDSSATQAQKFTANLGIYGAALSFITSIASAASESQIAETKMRQEAMTGAYNMELSAIEAVNKALSRQLEITKDIYGTDRISSYTKQLDENTAAQKSQLAALQGKYTVTGTSKELDELISEYNNGGIANKFQREEFEKAGGIKDQLLATGAIVDITNKSLEELQKLLDSGSLDSSTAKLVSSLVDLKQQYTDTMNALHADTIGESFDDILSGITSLFANATTSTQDFADNFEKIMQKSILNSFKRQYLEKQLQSFYDDFAAFTNANSGGSLDTSEIKKLQDEYNTIIANATKGFQDLEKATGISFDGTNGQNTLAGQIKGITADDASILASVFRGVQLAVVQSNNFLAQNGTVMQTQLVEMKAQTLLQKAIEVNTRRTADSIDNDVTPALNKIASNTASSAGLDQRAAGYWKY